MLPPQAAENATFEPLGPKLVKLFGLEEPVPALMFASCVVPERVPSDSHGSAPVLPSSALKITELPTKPMDVVAEEAESLSPGTKRSLSIAVPDDAPFDIHSSVPLVPSFAWKNSLPFPTASLIGE